MSRLSVRTNYEEDFTRILYTHVHLHLICSVHKGAIDLNVNFGKKQPVYILRLNHSAFQLFSALKICVISLRKVLIL